MLCLIPPPRETKRGHKVGDEVIQNIRRQCKNVIYKDKMLMLTFKICFSFSVLPFSKFGFIFRKILVTYVTDFHNPF